MLTFTIPGRPVPQKQTQFARGRSYDPSAKEKKRLQEFFKSALPEDFKPIESAVSASLHFCFKLPKTLTKAKKEAYLKGNLEHIIRPDVDNLAYLITNAMKEIVYKDDSQICSLAMYKHYSEEEQTLVIVHEREFSCE